jgi:hypothetical protein
MMGWRGSSGELGNNSTSDKFLRTAVNAFQGRDGLE